MTSHAEAIGPMVTFRGLIYKSLHIEQARGDDSAAICCESGVRRRCLGVSRNQ